MDASGLVKDMRGLGSGLPMGRITRFWGTNRPFAVGDRVTFKGTSPPRIGTVADPPYCDKEGRSEMVRVVYDKTPDTNHVVYWKNLRKLSIHEALGDLA